MLRVVVHGVAAAVVLLSGAGGAIGQSGKTPSKAVIPDVVATVNGERITREELADELIGILGRPALERMIMLKLVEQEARKHGVNVPDEAVNARLDQVLDARIQRWMKEGRMKNEAELDQFLQRTRGLTLERARAQTKAELRMLVRAELLAEKILGKVVTVSPEDVRAAFEREYGAIIHARQIVVQAREDAETVLAKLKAGADFELVAREVSIDMATRAKGGKMRPLSTGTQLGKAVAEVPAGGLSDVVRTDDGYHILKVIERTEGKKARIEDVQEELRKQILHNRIQERKPSWQTKLLERAQIKVNL